MKHGKKLAKRLDARIRAYEEMMKDPKSLASKYPGAYRKPGSLSTKGK